MKMKLKILIFICLIFLTNKINSQSFIGDQKQAVNCIIGTSYPSVNGPMYYEGYQCYLGVVGCSDAGNGQFTVTSLSITGNIYHEFLCNFTVFTDLSDLSIGKNRKITPNIFTQLPPNIINLSIYSFDEELPENLILPNSLQTINLQNANVPIPVSFFNTGSLKNLYVYNTVPGYSFPTSFTPNNNIIGLNLPVNSFSNYPQNLSQLLVGLETLSLSVTNDISSELFELPVVENYQNLKSLSFYFSTSPNVFNFNFTKSITEMTTINSLSIVGNGFNFSSEAPNFSKYQAGTTFVFNSGNSSYLQNSLFPINSTITFTGTNVDFLNFQFKNVISLTVLDNSFGEQELPDASLFDVEKMQFLYLQNNNLIGPLPNEYCSFKAGVLFLGGNHLSDQVPACFGCLGGGYLPFSSLFPNDFTDFTSSTPPLECTDFGLSFTFNPVLPTNQTSTITVHGSNIGWDISLLNNTQNGVSTQVTYPNYEFTVTIPPGAGINHVAEVGFGFEFQNKQKFEYSFEKPTITGFSVHSNQLFIQGTGFSYSQYYFNNITINDVEYSTNFLNLTNQDTDLSFPVENEPFTSIPFTNQMEFNVSVNVGGQISESKTFYYFSGVLIDNLKSFKFNSTGNQDFTFTLVGQLGVPSMNFENFNVNINGASLLVQSVNTTHAFIKGYPSAKVGINTFNVEFEGFTFEDNIEYVETPTFPPTPTPTPTPTSSSEDDEPSNTSTLKISYITLILLILVMSIFN